MKIRAIVFDIGGVIEITPETGWKDKWHRRLNMTVSEISTRLKARGCDGGLGTCSEKEWLAALQQITGMNPEQTDEFMGDLWEEYLGTLNIELADYAASLRPKYQTAILSNSFLGARQKEQDCYHFEELVDFIIYSHEVGLEKPDRRIYELTCQRLGLQSDEVAFLDDFEPNIIAALEFGIHGILFRDTKQAITDLETCLTGSS